MLATSINKVKLSCCIYNASGPRTYSVEALKKIAESRSGAVLAKSATKDRCDGNALPRCVNKVDLGSGYCQGSINSEGLPNFGMDYYTNGEALDVVESYNKPYIVSLSGFTLEDNMQMLEKVLQGSRVAAVELNVACPNIPDKPILAYDFEQLDAVLKAVTSHPQFGRLPLGVKLPPYFDTAHIEQTSTVLAKYPISFVVCCNSIPNGLFIDAENECEAMAANHGLGGLGGGFVKHTALANVRLFFKALNDKGRADIDIVGAGGVQSGQDAFELILCGAKAVQVGTCHWTEGAGCFDRIARELEGLMKKKGYGGIEDFRGNLKAYVKPKETKRVPETIHADAGGSAVSKAAKALDRSGSSGVVYLLLTVIAALLIAMSYTYMRDFVTVQYRDKVTVV